MSHWKVRDVMSTDVESVTEDTGYKEIVDLLAERGISAVPVIDIADHVVGVVSEADLLHKIEFAGSEPATRLFNRHRREHRKATADTARDLMTTPAVTIMADASIAEAARRMETAGVKRLPVVDDLGRPAGIVSRRDLLKVYTRADTAIHDEITAQVLRHMMWIGPDEVTVAVAEGVVTLTGQVEAKSTIPIVDRLTRAVDGVVDVVDRLTYRFDDTEELRARYTLSP